MLNLDKKDCTILKILQNNCRTSLTNIAKQVELSVDSIKKRIKKMENIIFYPRIQVVPRNLGYSNVVDIRIKLANHSKEEVDKFIKYLLEHPQVAELFTISGEWDLSAVIITKDLKDLERFTADVKSKFGRMINSWSESMTLKAHKFETYNIEKLLGFD